MIMLMKIFKIFIYFLEENKNFDAVACDYLLLMKMKM